MLVAVMPVMPVAPSFVMTMSIENFHGNQCGQQYGYMCSDLQNAYPAQEAQCQMPQEKRGEKRRVQSERQEAKNARQPQKKLKPKSKKQSNKVVIQVSQFLQPISPGAVAAQVGLQLDTTMICSDTEEGQKKAQEIIEKLSGSQEEIIIQQLLPRILTLSLASAAASKLVQVVITKAQGSTRNQIVEALAPHTVRLYQSPHGNYVLQKLVQSLPVQLLQGIIEKLKEVGWKAVTEHRFGCRVVERLLEHEMLLQDHSFAESVLENVDALCIHKYGHFVIRAIFEHAPILGKRVIAGILDKICSLAVDSRASYVVQSALEMCDPTDEEKIADVFLQSSDPSLEQIVCSKSGSYIAKAQLVNLRSDTFRLRMIERFRAYCDTLRIHPFGHRVAAAIGVEVPSKQYFLQANNEAAV
eukprot:TRINITY_DN112106_c0_g1_i1.p1 TRINITY_DN112106_c0_g1~~TRINITY_DN112106_c0_g1_i1.p1  ORF type:complete len:413 (-),score=85.02 TRINITY_DN112106_c0_g1_i1:395-1633(-)